AETQVPRGIPVQERAGRHHFRVQARPRRDLPVEVAAVPIGPVHHRRDAEAPILGDSRHSAYDFSSHWMTDLATKPRMPNASTKKSTNVPKRPALDSRASFQMMKSINAMKPPSPHALHSSV